MQYKPDESSVLIGLKNNNGKMNEPVTIIKTSEKVLIWLHRNKQTQQWLANEFGVTRQSVSQKITDNLFLPKDIMTLKRLGCPL